MKNTQENLRESRGLEIVQKNNQIDRVDQSTYRVLSQSGNGEYAVCLSEMSGDANVQITVFAV